MKTSKLFIQAASTFILPLFACGQDSLEPGKSSGAAKNPPPSREALAPGQPGQRDPGKASDSVNEPNPANTERQFSGRITSVSRGDGTITINDQTRGSQVLRIGEATRLKRGSSSASWDDLKVGENVQGVCRDDGNQAHASWLEIGK